MNIEKFRVGCRGLEPLYGFQEVNINLFSLQGWFLFLVLSQMNKQVLFPQLQSVEASVTFIGSD